MRGGRIRTYHAWIGLYALGVCRVVSAHGRREMYALAECITVSVFTVRLHSDAPVLCRFCACPSSTVSESTTAKIASDALRGGGVPGAAIPRESKTSHESSAEPEVIGPMSR